MKRRLCLVLMLALGALGLTGCFQGTLAGSSWVLREYGAPGSLTPVLTSTTVSLNFNADATELTGNAGCNAYGGKVALSGLEMTVSDLAQTEMACLTPGVMAQEAAYTGLLAQAARFSLNGDELVIYSRGGELLVFARAQAVPQSLAGQSYRLTSYGTSTSATAVLPGTLVTLSFNEGGKLGGNAGCNTYGGDYAAGTRTGTGAASLTISNLVQTKTFCLEPAGLMAQEAAYLEALGQAESYRLAGQALTIYSQGGRVLSFAALPAPTTSAP